MFNRKKKRKRKPKQATESQPRKRWLSRLRVPWSLGDVIAVVGVSFIVYAAWMAWQPLGIFVGGCAVSGLGLFIDMRKKKA